MTLLDMLHSISSFVRVRLLARKAIIDDIIFRCHYRVTCALLLACCTVVTATNLIGDPIVCQMEDSWSRSVSTFCWVVTTYTLPNYSTDSAAPYPGIYNDYGEKKTYHNYYQWVPFALLLHGISFYVSHWIWKNWEGGKMDAISDGMRGVLMLPTNERLERQETVVRYLASNLNTHGAYAIRYFFCEFLNFANVLANIFLMDKFLGGAFLTYGIEVLKYSSMNQWDRADPMIKIFPRMTKCRYQLYGPSGTVSNYDLLCILPLNVLNEKVYIFLWFWFLFIAVLTAASLMYSTVVVLFPVIRRNHYLKRLQVTREIKPNIPSLHTGDLFLFHLLEKNINAKSFRDVLTELIIVRKHG